MLCLVNEEILSKVKIIDLSADFRIKDVEVYKQWYKLEHGSPEYIKEAVYGLPEINRAKLQRARLIANPGCLSNLFLFVCLSSGKRGHH